MIAGSSRAQAADLLARVDHLVYATPDLDIGIDTIEKLLGIRATLGGQHFGKGTHNALIALGSSTYLEIVGRDALQPKPETPRWFGIDDLPVPKLVAWAAKGNDLTRLVTEAADQGVDLGGVKSGSRRRLDGLLLTWQFTDPGAVIADGIVPFFIDWGRSAHPAASAAQHASLMGLRAEHPAPQSVQELLGQLGVALPVNSAPKPGLIATISCRRGLVELR